MQSGLVLALTGSWLIGLTPGVLARYVWKKAPVPLLTAIMIAGISCLVLTLAIAAASETFGFLELRSTWASGFAGAAFVSVGIMTRGKRQHLIAKLEAMIADPATSDALRASANDGLRKLRS